MKIEKYGVLAGIMILGLLFALSGCSLGGDDPDYKIEFTIAGTDDYVFTAGYTTDPDNIAEGCETSSGGETVLIAENADDDSKIVSLTFEGTATGTYADSDIIFSTTVFTANGLSHNDFTAGTDFELTVTGYGPVGGAICGTFSGTVKDRDTPATYDLTEGYFCVKRKDKGAIVLK
jgi:hypothetical protein